MKARIIGTGSYLPEQIIKNDAIRSGDSAAESIKRLTGISERRFADPSGATSDLAAAAAERAIAVSGLNPACIDLIIISTTSPDKFFPSTACLVQSKIKAVNSAAFDISASCSGFLYALAIAESYISCGMAEYILIIGAEVKSRFLDKKDISTYSLFGDGAGAVILKKEDGENEGIQHINIGADGRKKDLIALEIDREKINSDPEAGRPVIKMDGQKLFKTAVSKFTQIISDTLKNTGRQIKDIDWFIFHQANIRILHKVCAKAGIPLEKTAVTINKYGNTSSASIPITLDTFISEGKIKKGDTLLLASFGGGITWGTAIIKI